MSDDHHDRFPHSLEAERSVLGALLIDNSGFRVVADIIDSRHYYRLAHSKVHAAIYRLIRSDKVADLVTLANELERVGELEDVGGPAYIAALVDGIPHSTNVEWYARIVKEHFDRRHYINVATTLALGARVDEDLPGLAERVTRSLELPTSELTSGLPDMLTLRQRLARPPVTLRYRIDGWQPIGSRVILAAQYKAGKTTFRDNAIRCLVDGDPFLNVHAVTPIDGNLLLLDFEMSEQQFDLWLGTQRIVADDRVVALPLRGYASAFDLLSDRRRRQWAAACRAFEVSYLVWDCARPIMDALGLDENKDAGRLLTAFDEFLIEAGVSEALIVHHMGHNGERARGDSRFRDWPDVEWRLVRKDEQPDSPRFLSAFGRDVNMPERELLYDGITRRLSVIGGSRQDAKIDVALDAVIEALGAQQLSGRQIKTALRDSEIARHIIEEALKAGAAGGRLSVTDGPHGAHLYQVSRSVPSVSQNTPSECPAAYIRRDTRTVESETRVSRGKANGGIRV